MCYKVSSKRRVLKISHSYVPPAETADGSPSQESEASRSTSSTLFDGLSTCTHALWSAVNDVPASDGLEIRKLVEDLRHVVAELTGDEIDT